MARAALLHMLKSQTRNFVPSATFTSSVHHCHSTVPWEHNLVSRSTFSSSFLFSASQKRWVSQAAQTEDDSRISIGPQRGGQPTEDEKETGVVYYGPISSTVKKVKLLSLSTCCLSVSLGPVITFMTSTDSNVILKGAVASTVIFFSASTTAALHWFVGPYIHKLRWQPGSDSFEVGLVFLALLGLLMSDPTMIHGEPAQTS